MTAIANANYHRQVRFPWLLLAVILAAVAIGTAISHYHPEAATVRNCINDNGYLQVWWNADNQHRIEVCQVAEHMWGLRILKRVDGKWQELSAFIRRQASTIQELDQYLTNSGAIQTWAK